MNSSELPFDAEPGSAPTPEQLAESQRLRREHEASQNWTRHLRPVDAPAPDWAQPPRAASTSRGEHAAARRALAGGG